MALTFRHLRTAEEVVGGAASLREAVARWRTQHPDVRTVVVDAMDMRGETPALQLGARNVYLAATNGHCWHVTQQPEDATALILTQDEDETPARIAGPQAGTSATSDGGAPPT